MCIILIIIIIQYLHTCESAERLYTRPLIDMCRLPHIRVNNRLQRSKKIIRYRKKMYHQIYYVNVCVYVYNTHYN